MVRGSWYRFKNALGRWRDLDLYVHSITKTQRGCRNWRHDFYDLVMQLEHADIAMVTFNMAI